MAISVPSRRENGRGGRALVAAGNGASSSKSSCSPLRVYTGFSLVPPWCMACSWELTAGTRCSTAGDTEEAHRCTAVIRSPLAEVTRSANRAPTAKKQQVAEMAAAWVVAGDTTSKAPASRTGW